MARQYPRPHHCSLLPKCIQTSDPPKVEAAVLVGHLLGWVVVVGWYGADKIYFNNCVVWDVITFYQFKHLKCPVILNAAPYGFAWVVYEYCLNLIVSRGEGKSARTV